MRKVKVNGFGCSVRLSVLVLGIVASVMLTGVNSESGGLGRDCALNQVRGNPHDPHTFYWCLSEGPVLMKCVNDLVFDAFENKCISEKVQKRRQKSREKAAMLNQVLEQSSSRKGKPSTATLPAGVRCPPHIYEGSKATTSIYYADPNSCSSFYQCSHGEAHLHNCPDGLLFNSELNVCDHPANVRTCTDKQQAVKPPSSPSSSSSSSSP